MPKHLSENAYLRLYALMQEMAQSRDIEKHNDAKALHEALSLIGAPWGAVQLIALTDRINVERQGRTAEGR